MVKSTQRVGLADVIASNDKVHLIHWAETNHRLFPEAAKPLDPEPDEGRIAHFEYGFEEVNEVAIARPVTPIWAEPGLLSLSSRHPSTSNRPGLYATLHLLPLKCPNSRYLKLKNR